MLRQTASSLLLVSSLAVSAGCHTAIKNQRIGDSTALESADTVPDAKNGVPWVEPRQYEVIVHSGTGAGTSEQIYYGRHYLLDKVSGTFIDRARPKWQTNYRAAAFADGSVTLTFDDLGSLSKAEASSSSAATGLAKAAAQAVDTPDAIDSKELERLERKLKRLETEKKINDVREALNEN